METKNSQEVILVEVTATDVKIHIASDPAPNIFCSSRCNSNCMLQVLDWCYTKTNIVTGTGSHKTGQSAYDLDAPVVTDKVN